MVTSAVDVKEGIGHSDGVDKIGDNCLMKKRRKLQRRKKRRWRLEAVAAEVI